MIARVPAVILSHGSGGLNHNREPRYAAALTGMGVAVLAIAWWLGSSAIGLVGAILVAHTGMDRAAGYGLKYPDAFGATHLGWRGKRNAGAGGRGMDHG